MIIISFGWTTAALLARRKSVTRRDWNDAYAARFKPGQLCQAWNTSPRNVRANPHQIGVIRILSVSKEALKTVPDTDWEAEGFAYLELIGAKVAGYEPREIWDNWKNTSAEAYVVRFEIVGLGEDAQVNVELPLFAAKGV